MWLPELLSSVEGDMKNKGCHFSADDVYSINHSSMKDAVVLFGGGCTGEIISDSGLLLTNHHCGLGQVQSHSSVEHDYVTDGFWAMNRKEELPCPSLTVTFIESMEDVTNQIFPYVKNIADETRRQKVTDSLSQAIGWKNAGFVKSFYYGNQFILIKTKTFSDVRLVGAPPISIGNFGGETDNWIWPRHTGDFSLFRVYANKNNDPSAYSTENIPYKPKYFFPISLKGENENDFTMVYGFPGRTQEYISSYAVDLIQNVSDSERVYYRTKKLDVWWNSILANDTVRIKYISKYYGLANGWKKMQGEMKGLKESNVIAKKQEFETEFTNRVNANVEWKKSYSNILPQLKTIYDSLKIMQPILDSYGEGELATELVSFAQRFEKLVALYEVEENFRDNNSIQKEIESLKNYAVSFFKDYDAAIDQKVLHAFNPYLSVSIFQSFLIDKNKVMNFLNHVSEKSIKKLKKDAAFAFISNIDDNMKKYILPKTTYLQNKLVVLNRSYMEAQMVVFPEKKFFPDANSTLRVAYGNVLPYVARDAVEFNWFTTLDGVVQKTADISNQDFIVPEKLVELWLGKDYGQYADKDGTLHTCFIAANHTTGGNSGSPVLDADGNLIGTNFDRVWEGTMSDINFDTTRCRNIILDVRYTLFIIDKFAGAGYLLKEMKIKK